MDGENNGSKPYEQMDDLGFSHIFGNTQFVHADMSKMSSCLARCKDLQSLEVSHVNKNQSILQQKFLLKVRKFTYSLLAVCYT